MQSARSTSYEIKQEKEAVHIVISQISLLLTALTERNFKEIEKKIDFLLEKSPFAVYIKYWEKLLVLCSRDIKNNHTLAPQDNLIHRLLATQFLKLPLKAPGAQDTLSREIFSNFAFLDQCGLKPEDLEVLFDATTNDLILESVNPNITIKKLASTLEIKMNNINYFQNFLLQSAATTLESNLTDLLHSLEGESLNDMVALMLSEVISPGSQRVQQETQERWLNPQSAAEATNIGNTIFKSIDKLPKDAINWNRVFNLMSTKYFLTTLIKPTIASLSSFFACLQRGRLIDQFFGCDWDMTFKLDLAFLLHQWSPQQGCFDLLSVEGTRKVTDLVPNSKGSLLYLLSVASLDLELFLLRDELSSNPMLPYYQECFFEDFNQVPELLGFALLSNMKHFTLLVENKTIINEIMVTLLVQTFERSPDVLGPLIEAIPDNDRILEATRIILSKEKLRLSELVKILAIKGKLDNLIEQLSFAEALKITPCARKVGWLGFEDFIQKRLNINTASLILDTLDLQAKMTDANNPFAVTERFDLPALHFLITTMVKFSLKESDLERFEGIQFSLIIAFPRLINYGFGHDQAILSNGDINPIAPDVEKEMQNYLQKMYSGELAIKDIIDILRKLRDSQNVRDQDVFACMTHAVIAESSFFRDYPLDALATTSVLFGSMILFQLLRGFVLDVAFRIILNFAKEGPESKMFKFAVQAIYAFKIRLLDYPNYCKDLLEYVPGLQTQPQVYQSVLEAAKSAERLHSKTPDDARKPVETIPLKYFVLEEPSAQVLQENPPKEITEKVLFVVNNITMDNFDVKIIDLKTVLTPNYFSWFSNYLVNQRAKTEPNYHKLYSRILTSIKSDLLHEYMVAVTCKQLYIFLSTKDAQLIDKNHLKNMAMWLGSITLSLDRPIRHRNIAFRELLLEAYMEKRLNVVVPFVAKVLQNAADSKVFRPPNPWTVGIVRLLLELNNKANWKLSLTFEVEVLLKSLNIDPKSITPTDMIGANNAVDELAGSINNLTVEQRHAEQQRQMMTMQQYQQQVLLSQQRQQRVISGGLVPSIEQRPVGVETSALAGENPFNNLNGSTIFATHPDLMRVFQMAMAKSVREVLLPAVDKATSIAVVTTMKIVLKDFATEVDEMKLKAAAIGMVRHLSQSLARTTAVEPLKEVIVSTTHSLAPNLMGMQNSFVDELNTAINDNLGVALAIIEKAAMDKATQDIGEQLMQPIAIRRYHKERRAGQPFLTQNTNPYSLTLPEPLGLKSSGVTPQQFSIYENLGDHGSNFENAPDATGPPQNQQNHQQILLQQQQARPQQQQHLAPTSQMHVPPVQNQLPIQNSQGMGIQSELEQNHRVLVHLMDGLVVQIKENADKRGLRDLGEQNSIKAIIFQILSFIARSSQKDQLALKVSQAVVNSLFATSESPLCREVLSMLLEKLCSLSIVARKDVVWWLVYALDSRKFNVSVIRSLLDVKLIDASELDNVLVTTMKNKMENSVNFSMELIRDTVMSSSPILMRMDFICTLEYLGTLDDANVKSFLRDYEKEVVLPVELKTKVTNTERYYLVFTEWVKLLQRVEGDDISTIVFLKQMKDKGVLSKTDQLIEFIKAALELSIFSFKESDPTGEVFTAIDALGKMIIKLLVVQDFTEMTRADYLNLVFPVIALVFSKDHEQENTTFNERPHFRLLSNFLFEWETIRGHNFIKVRNVVTRKELLDFDTEFYNIFSSYLQSAQPIAFPGFSFAWVTLISHRMFLPTMLRLPNNAGWKNLMLLLIDLLKFLDKYTDKNEVSNAISVVYKGALRVFLGISNDMPEFLIENHLELMNNLPPTYFQLKNVILSAIPKKMMLPNPYDPTLSLEDIAACKEPPKVFYDLIAEFSTLKKPVDNYLRIPSNSLLKTIISNTYRNEYELKNGIGYDYLSVDNNIVRAIVVHVGIEVGSEYQRMSSSAVFNTKSAYYTLLFNLIHDGTVELQYQVIEAMVEQLRYPNVHTYWFIFALRNMFVSEEWGDQLLEVQEIILRNLLERIIVNRPHTWGISVIFTQLITSKEINLLDLPFVKNLPEVRNLLSPLYRHTSTGNSIDNSNHQLLGNSASGIVDAKV